MTTAIQKTISEKLWDVARSLNGELTKKLELRSGSIEEALGIIDSLHKSLSDLDNA